MAPSTTKPCVCEGECQALGIWMGEIQDAQYLFEEGVRYLVRSGPNGTLCYARCKESNTSPPL